MSFDFARLTAGDEVLFGTDPRFTRPRPGTVLDVFPDANPPTLVVKDVASPRVYNNCWYEGDPTIKQRSELFVTGGNHAQFRLSKRTERQWDMEDRLVSLAQDVLALTDENVAITHENVALRADVDSLMRQTVSASPKVKRKNAKPRVANEAPAESQTITTPEMAKVTA